MPVKSLSTLMSECGDWFQYLENAKGEWRAVAMDSTLVGIGVTPEGAVEALKEKLIERVAI